MKSHSARALAAIHASTLLVLLAVFTIVAFLVPFPTRAQDIYKWLVPVFALYLGGFHLLRVFRDGRQKKGKKI
jgi:hypothetical protein